MRALVIVLVTSVVTLLALEERRRRLNFWEWDRPQREAREAARALRRGDMPPRHYRVPRERARPSAVERQELVLGFEATFGARRPRDGVSRSGPMEDDP